MDKSRVECVDGHAVGVVRFLAGEVMTLDDDSPPFVFEYQLHGDALSWAAGAYYGFPGPFCSILEGCQTRISPFPGTEVSPVYRWYDPCRSS